EHSGRARPAAGQVLAPRLEPGNYARGIIQATACHMCGDGVARPRHYAGFEESSLVGDLLCDQELVARFHLIAATPRDDASHTLDPQPEDHALWQLLEAIAPSGSVVEPAELQHRGRVRDPRV